MSTPDPFALGRQGDDAVERPRFSPETGARLWAETAVFAHLLVTLIPGYDFTKTELYQRYCREQR